MDVPGHHHHQVVRQREAGVLTPPPVKGQGHIETCYKRQGFIFRSGPCETKLVCLFSLTEHKQNRDEVGVGELVAVKGDTLKQILLPR